MVSWVVMGSNSRPSPLTFGGFENIPKRLWKKIALDEESGCWLWTGSVTCNGYGQVHWEGKTRAAHKVLYELFFGPVPKGLDLDHVRAWGCLHRHCVNPAHLEPVTRKVNLNRGSTGNGMPAINRAKTHCPHGHPYDEANTYRAARGDRHCRICRGAAAARYKKKETSLGLEK